MTGRSVASASALCVAITCVGPVSWSAAAAQAPPVPTSSEAQTCIAIVLPSVKGATGDATGFAISLRDLLISYLTGPSVRAIGLDARLASQAIEEARQKQCGNVLMTAVELKRHDGNGWGRALGRAAGSAAWYGVPYGGTAATAAARGVAIAGAEAVSAMAQTTRAKDEVTLEYRFGSVETAARATPKAEKAKARSDGEDLLTPLVEKVSEAIVAIALKK